VTADYCEEDWSRDNFAESSVLEDLKKNCRDTIERINYHEVSQEEFVQRFVETSTPVIVRGVVDTWKGREQLNWKVRIAD
jgi:hypothetical protein